MVTKTYHSPLGEILLAANADGLTGLWFAGQRHFGSTLDADGVPNGLGSATAVLDYTWAWLDAYFAGHAPVYTPPLALRGPDFHREVWQALLAIPRGTVTTYSELAGEVARRRGVEEEAPNILHVGRAVARNPVSVIVPSHRVVGAGGRPTGSAEDAECKCRLLAMERVDIGVRPR